jgi:hypothetical protein
MFGAKISGKFTYGKKFGEKIDPAEKWICGVIFVGTMLFFLVGPFLLFSNLSLIASPNLVTGAQVDFKVKIYNLNLREVYEFPLFEANNPKSLITVDEAYFYEKGYDELPETKFFTYDQIQIIKINNGSESAWALSEDYKNYF